MSSEEACTLYFQYTVWKTTTW